MKPIDLHTHTTMSDGTLTPRELVRHAASEGVGALAITDHDTVAGLDEALEAGAEFGVEVIGGTELGVEAPHGGIMHILGLFLPSRPTHLLEVFDYMRDSRKRRNQAVVHKLNEHGVDITLAEVEDLAQSTVGRPHFAQLLLKKGVVSRIQEAFEHWLGNGAKAHVPKEKLSPARGMAALAADGATVILAHPYLMGLPPDRTEQVVRELMGQGLEGIEAYYSEHGQAETELYLNMADRLGLVVSGGSDFHGAVKPHIRLGRGKGGLFVPPSVLDDLKAYRRAKGLPVTQEEITTYENS